MPFTNIRSRVPLKPSIVERSRKKQTVRSNLRSKPEKSMPAQSRNEANRLGDRGTPAPIARTREIPTPHPSTTTEQGWDLFLRRVILFADGVSLAGQFV